MARRRLPFLDPGCIQDGSCLLIPFQYRLGAPHGLHKNPRRRGIMMRWLLGFWHLSPDLPPPDTRWRTMDLRQPSQPATAATAASDVIVNAAHMKIGTIRRQIEAVGSLRSDELVIVRPEIAGRISEILFEEGQQVSRGTPLVRLDAAIARAQVEQQNASLALSRVNHERAQDLMRKGAGSQRAFDEALAKLRADEAALALAQATLDKSTLMAPFDGILGLRKVSVGDYVNPGQDIVNIEHIETLKVDFRVPETYAAQLKAGQAIRVSLDAIPGKHIRRQGLCNRSGARSERTRRHPARANSQRGRIAALRHVRARHPDHRGSQRETAAIRDSAGADGAGPLRVPGRGREGEPDQDQDRSAPRRRNRGRRRSAHPTRSSSPKVR